MEAETFIESKSLGWRLWQVQQRFIVRGLA